MPGVSPPISLRGVVKRFGGRAVLDGIDFDVHAGETMVIMGGSGSGKSTLLRTIIGSFAPDEGSVSLFGRDMAGLSADDLNEVRKRFGILFQSGALFNSMTIAQNVALPLQEHTDLDANIIDIQVKIKLEMVGLLEAADRYPAEISGGMKKRAGLARALALDPEILFYDEPSAGLDPVTSAQIDQLIVSLSRQLGVTSVVVTHEMDSAFTIADRMCMLDKGRMIIAETREWFDRLRKASPEEASGMDDRDRLIRQFLRGDAEGPITDRKQTGLYERQLLGVDAAVLLPTPSLEPTRRK
ncbi:MAG TPA: ABC transporter ATP-binding protein [Phycisphaerales bacterium]|nr:ABC transporter ATP-binding protein [Phycisphaerales bacterium]